MMMPPRISPDESPVWCESGERTEAKGVRERERSVSWQCPLGIGGLRINPAVSSGGGVWRRGVGYGRVKSWSRFTSYHLRMSRWLPLALPTVARQKKTPAPTLSRPAKTRFFLAYRSLRSGRNSKGLRGNLFFRLDYIGNNRRGRERAVGVAMKVSLIRFADDSKKERSTAWKGFLGHTCGDRTRRRLFGRITRDCDCLIDIHSCEKFHI